MQAAGGSSGSDSINSTTVTADPIAVISTHILAGLQVREMSLLLGEHWSAQALQLTADAQSLVPDAVSHTPADPGDAADAEPGGLAVADGRHRAADRHCLPRRTSHRCRLRLLSEPQTAAGAGCCEVFWLTSNRVQTCCTSSP